jgi:hypothetical protein
MIGKVDGVSCLVALFCTSLAFVRIRTQFPQSVVLLSVIRGFGCLRSDVRLCADKNYKTSEGSFMCYVASSCWGRFTVTCLRNFSSY